MIACLTPADSRWYNRCNSNIPRSKIPLGDPIIMDFVQYFIESNVPFGGVSGAMLFVWALALGIGVYLLRSYRDSNPVRARFMRQAGLITAILSGTGLVLLLLKFLNVPVLEWRLWGWLVALAWLGYTGYAIYTYNTTLPAQIAANKPARIVRSSGSGGRSKVYSAPTTPVTPREPREPRPIATTTRREARRDKKRKGR